MAKKCDRNIPLSNGASGREQKDNVGSVQVFAPHH